jgi:hypothetical protein
VRDALWHRFGRRRRFSEETLKKLSISLVWLIVAGATACSQSAAPGGPASPSALTTAASSVTVQSKAGPARATYIPVTTIISDVDVNGIAADIASDGQGPYADTCTSPSGNGCGGTGVASFLTPNGYNGIGEGDWQFDTYASTRKVAHSFDLDDAIQSGDPHFTVAAKPPFWGTQSLPSHIEVKCTLLNKSMLTMTAGAVTTCPMVSHFTTTANIEYTFGLAVSFTGFPETTDVQITCNAVDAGGCKDWNLDPIGSGPGVGRLQLVGKKADTNEGDFYTRFHIHVTRP